MAVRPTPFAGNAVSAAPSDRNVAAPVELSPSFPRKPASTIAANLADTVARADASGIGTNLAAQEFTGASDAVPLTCTSLPLTGRFTGPGPTLSATWLAATLIFDGSSKVTLSNRIASFRAAS